MHDQPGENGDEQRQTEAGQQESRLAPPDETAAFDQGAKPSAVGGMAAAVAGGGMAIALIIGAAKRGGKVVHRSADNVPWRSMDSTPPRSTWEIGGESVRGSTSPIDSSWRIPYHAARAIERSQRGQRADGGPIVGSAQHPDPLVAVLEAGRGCSMAGDGWNQHARVRAWGSDADGLVERVPALSVGSERAWADFVIDLSLGDGHALAVVVARDVGGRQRGRPRIVAWGDRSLGRCETPVQFTGDVAPQHVAAGAAHSVALDTSGVVYCWGDNRLGQCDPPDRMPRAERIAAGGGTSIAVARTGTLWAWGDDSFGQCVPPNTLASVRTIDAGERHVAAVTYDGRVVCWGDGSLGQCSTPEGLRDARELSAGGSHTLVLVGDGRVIAFGSNASGQCTVPRLADDETFVAVSAGHDHSLALTSDRRVVAWGDNTHGQCDLPSELRGTAAGSGPAQPR